MHLIERPEAQNKRRVVMHRFFQWTAFVGVSMVAVTAIVAGVYDKTATRLSAHEARVERGKYLVTLGNCMDCHTPGYFFGQPDMNRFLGGSEVGFEIPGLGVFHGRNLTPDKETGLGTWSEDEIV